MTTTHGAAARAAWALVTAKHGGQEPTAAAAILAEAERDGWTDALIDRLAHLAALTVDLVTVDRAVTAQGVLAIVGRGIAVDNDSAPSLPVAPTAEESARAAEVHAAELLTLRRDPEALRQRLVALGRAGRLVETAALLVDRLAAALAVLDRAEVVDGAGRTQSYGDAFGGPVAP